jgi:hypothetical protein
LGFCLIVFTQVNAYIGWFIIALGGLEVFSLRYRKSWWLARQLLSKAANTELTLIIDEKGLSSQSVHIQSHIAWADVTKLEKTKLGWLLYHAGGKTYLSQRCLSEGANDFVSYQATLKNT